MSMTETTEAPAVKKKVKRHARANKPSAPPAAKPSVLAGLTITDCATACFASGKCAISGSVCAHPGKGGLQVNLQTPENLQRFAAAKRIIGQSKLDLQNF